MDFKSAFTKTGFTKAELRKGRKKLKKPLVVGGVLVAAVAAGWGLFSKLGGKSSPLTSETRPWAETRTEPVQPVQPKVEAPKVEPKGTFTDLFSSVTKGESKDRVAKKAHSGAGKKGKKFAKGKGHKKGKRYAHHGKRHGHKIAKHKGKHGHHLAKHKGKHGHHLAKHKGKTSKKHAKKKHRKTGTELAHN